MKEFHFAGYTLNSGPTGLTVVRQYIKHTSGDYGADPIGDGMFKMVPSGDIVDYAERCKRLAK